MKAVLTAAASPAQRVGQLPGFVGGTVPTLAVKPRETFHSFNADETCIEQNHTGAGTMGGRADRSSTAASSTISPVSLSTTMSSPLQSPR